YHQPGAHTFDIPVLTYRLGNHPLPIGAQNFIFPLLLFGFGILVSLWPFHTWAPLGYGSAPGPTAMLHAGVLKKFGLYALIRVAIPLMPDAPRMHVFSPDAFTHFPLGWLPLWLGHFLQYLGWFDLLA